MYNKYISLNI